MTYLIRGRSFYFMMVVLYIKWRMIIMTKVILREDFNKFNGKDEIMVIFPEDKANIGYIGTINMYFDGDKAIFWSYDEADIDIVMSKKIIHKNDERVPKIVEALEKQFDDRFEVVEKIMNNDRYKQ